MTEKTFEITGVSTLNGKTKIRFANDIMRIKVLDKNGHQEVELVNLPRPMTKAEIAVHLEEIDFAKGRMHILDAVRYVAKKNPLVKAETTAEVIETEAVPA
mgnify:CR=1 FL=1